MLNEFLSTSFTFDREAAERLQQFDESQLVFGANKVDFRRGHDTHGRTEGLLDGLGGAQAQRRAGWNHFDTLLFLFNGLRLFEIKHDDPSRSAFLVDERRIAEITASI